jgi:hypothetical protein
MWTHKDRSMKQMDEFQTTGIWQVAIYGFVIAKYLCKHSVPVLYLLLLEYVFERTKKLVS